MARSTVTVCYVGNDDCRRYYIVRPSDGLYWTGSCWSYQRHEALLYENLQLCHEDYQRLITQDYAHKPIQYFKVVTHVVVRSDVPVTKKQVRRYLEKAYRGIVDTDACGDGPVEGSLVILRTDFDTLSEAGPPQG